MAFQEYRHMLDETILSKCPKCDETQHNLQHWFLHCPGTMAAKQQLFGGDDNFGLHLLTMNPNLSLALARRTLLGVGSSHQ